MELSDEMLIRAMDVLGLEPLDFDKVRSAKPPLGPALLKKLKAKARKSYRRAAKTYHPDKTGGDSHKTEVFQAATSVLAEVEAMTYIAPKPTYRWTLKLGGRLW